MSHPKNSTPPHSVQHPALTPLIFGGANHHLLAIREGQDLAAGLELATDLAEGIHHLCGRLQLGLDDGEEAAPGELAAIGFLGRVVSALTRSARLSIAEQNRQGDQ